MTDETVFPVPDHIKGPMKRGSQCVKDRAEWIRRADAAGLTRRQMAAALEVKVDNIWHICLKALGPKGRTNGVANAARLKKLHDQRHGKKNGVTYAELHASGLTAREAAARRGESLTAAKRWAKDTGKIWADGRAREETREFHRRRLREIEPKRQAAYKAILVDPERHRLALLTPEQRADYDLMIRANVPSDEAAAMVGCPEAGLNAWKVAQAKKAAARTEERKQAAQRRKFQKLAQRDPEAAMLLMMQARKRSTRGQHADAHFGTTDAREAPQDARS